MWTSIVPECSEVDNYLFISHHPKQTLPKVIHLTNKHNDFFMTINIVGDLLVSNIITTFVLRFSYILFLGVGAFVVTGEYTPTCLIFFL